MHRRRPELGHRWNDWYGNQAAKRRKLADGSLSKDRWFYLVDGDHFLWRVEESAAKRFIQGDTSALTVETVSICTGANGRPIKYDVEREEV